MAGAWAREKTEYKNVEHRKQINKYFSPLALVAMEPLQVSGRHVCVEGFAWKLKYNANRCDFVLF